MNLDLVHIFARRVGAAVRAAEEPILDEPRSGGCPQRRGRGWLPVHGGNACHRAGMSSWCLPRSRVVEEKWWLGRRTPLSLVSGPPWLTPEPLAGLEVVSRLRPRHQSNNQVLDPSAAAAPPQCFAIIGGKFGMEAHRIADFVFGLALARETEANSNRFQVCILYSWCLFP
ncbi:uncharacterized protein [Triticum aestivum]|uniref:uncharacterized protein n=1 Tax=Triticum aestivum TaxID=4565 RepID=UPI001D00C334|nr:uncharacterized protein LOC123133249 [Triticum aestivum]